MLQIPSELLTNLDSINGGAEVHRGSLEDLGSLRSGAATSEGVIHTAFIAGLCKVEDA